MNSTKHQSSTFENILLFESTQRPINFITYFDELGNKQKIQDKIISVKMNNAEKYLVLENSNPINLELVYSVDGEVTPYYSDGYFSCDCV
ncbi:MAG: hypothetical protein JXQ96_12960 [Cyclobacteriaceae bacterium]